ncbi:MAG: cupin domain-containing protein [Polyangiaceae bacterium]
MADAELEASPICADHVLEGAPFARAKLLGESGDGGASFGVWTCTPGRFRWYFAADETVHILEGEVTVRVNDEERPLTAGSVAFFPIGTWSEWTVTRYVRKIFFLRHPSPYLKRALND